MTTTLQARDLPAQLPLIVYSGAYSAKFIEPLRIAKVDAVMCSFEYIRSNPVRFHEQTMPRINWGPHTFLDSGIFSLMRRTGVSRAKIHGSKSGVSNPVVEFKKLAKDYVAYLEKYGQYWDHLVELDVDSVLGGEATLATRRVLRRIVGDRLLPVWHLSAGQEGWERLIAEFPYVSIGGDAGVMGEGHSDRTLAMIRRMVQESHARGTKVHGMGDTKPSTFRATGWDTADSTTWVNGQRFGHFGPTRYSEHSGSNEGSKMTKMNRSFEQWLIEHQLDPLLVAKPGMNTHKLLANIYNLQERERVLQQERSYAKQQANEFSTGS